MKRQIFGFWRIVVFTMAVLPYAVYGEDAPPVQNSPATVPISQEIPKTESVNGIVTLAPLGDSRTAIISYDTAHLNLSTQNHFNWANALNQQKYPYTGDFGISGATSDQIIAQMLTPALATHPTYMPILMGVNDVRSPGFSAEHTMANIAEAANKALAQGTIPIVFTDPGSEHYNAAQVAFINDVNARIKVYCSATTKTVLFDMAALVSTQRTPTIAFQPGWSYDGIHLQTVGAYNVGAAFADLMNSFGIAAPIYPGLSGNLLINPDFSVVTGGHLGTGNTGSLPSSFTGIPENIGCTTEFSLNTRKDAAKEIVVKLTAITPNKLGGVRVIQQIPVTGVSPGDNFQAGVQVDIDGGSVNLDDVRAEVDFTFKDGTFAIANDFVGTVARAGKPTRDTISSIPGSPGMSLTLQSPVNPYPADKELTGIKFTLGVRVAGNGKATVRFRNPWCKKIIPQ
jgi:hypothetical protein